VGDAEPPTDPKEPATHFAFPDDNGSFTKASMRCIGLGECRKDLYGTMCPSYMVTREEEHSTRGRARLLWEMLQGEAIRDGWKDEQVKQSLDLCLSCKACKSECPTNVDIATYRAEFLSHYYESHSRPLHAHVFGKIDQWARLGSHAPHLGLRNRRRPARRARLRAHEADRPQQDLQGPRGEPAQRVHDRRARAGRGGSAGRSDAAVGPAGRSDAAGSAACAGALGELASSPPGERRDAQGETPPYGQDGSPRSGLNGMP